LKGSRRTCPWIGHGAGSEPKQQKGGSSSCTTLKRIQEKKKAYKSTFSRRKAFRAGSKGHKCYTKLETLLGEGGGVLG